jgi:hypothetical protein
MAPANGSAPAAGVGRLDALRFFRSTRRRVASEEFVGEFPPGGVAP